MMMFKACPRCKGDIEIRRDVYGRYAQCIQCGHTRDLPALPIAARRAA